MRWVAFGRMDYSGRFASLVQRQDHEIPLDVAALLIAVHADPAADVDAAVAELDAIAATCPGARLEDLRRHLFGTEGFRGDDEDYYDPANSLLHRVLERRRGIPITLSVVTMEVGRRIGLAIDGIGMPGHFLVRHEDTLFDPFDRGAVLDATRFDAEVLEPVGPIAIIARMLANLKQIYVTNGDATGLEWVLRLRTAIPGIPDEERHQLTRLRARWN